VHQTRVGTFPGSAAPVTVQVTEPSRRRTGCVFVAFEWGQRHGINSGSKCNFAGECAFQTPNGSLCNLRLGSKNWKYSDERSEGNNRRHLPFLLRWYSAFTRQTCHCSRSESAGATLASYPVSPAGTVLLPAPTLRSSLPPMALALASKWLDAGRSSDVAASLHADARGSKTAHAPLCRDGTLMSRVRGGALPAVHPSCARVQVVDVCLLHAWCVYVAASTSAARRRFQLAAA